MAACADYLLQPQATERSPRALTLSSLAVTLDDGQAAPLVATVFDQANQPFTSLPAGIAVKWSSSADSVASVNDTGLIAGNRQGKARVTASVNGSAGTVSLSADVTVRPVPTALAALSGDSQSGTVGTRLGQPFKVRVTDRHNLAVAGEVVSFLVAAGRGSLAKAADTTDTAGVAATTLTLDTLSGAATIEARDARLPAAVERFAARATAGAVAALAKVSGDSQSALAKAALPAPLVVRVRDRYGNVVPGVAVGWQVTEGGGALSATGTTSDTLGLASVTWTLGDSLGTQTARASIGGLLLASFTATARPGTTADSWLVAGGGDWYTAANWSRGAVPGATDTAAVTLSGTYRVDALDGADLALARLVVGAPAGAETLAVTISHLATTDGIAVTGHGVLELIDQATAGPGALVNGGTLGLQRSTVHPLVTNTGTLDVSKWDSLLGGLSNAGTIAVELGGHNAGVDHGQLSLAGSVTLGGTLSAVLVNGFVPAPGDSFVVVTGTALAGAFGTVSLPALPAGTWQTSTTAAGVTLRVVGSGLATTPVTLSAGMDHACFIASDNSLWCWGANAYGQLGDGTTTARLHPIQVAAGYRFAAVSAGERTTCALKADGTAWCWGDNTYGQLGDGSFTGSLTPVPVSGGLVFARLLAGAYFTCGLATGGAAYCWGGASPRLGNGTNVTTNVPVAVAGGLTFKEISLFSDNHACAVTPTGVAYCWGYNYDGEIGDGTTTDRLVPTPASGGHTFPHIFSGYYHSCALDAAGGAWCWGDNNVDQLGWGTPPTDGLVPGAVQGGHVFSTLSAGGGQTCGLEAGGVAWCWGLNNSGALGNGTTTWSLAPVAVSGGLSFAVVSVGNGFACGLTVGSAIYCWGDNTSGQLGDGTTTTRLSPVPILLSAATHLAFAQQPTAVTVGGAFSPAVQVQALDASNSAVPSLPDPITIALGANPGSATLGGLTSVSLVNGVATFTDLTVSAAGSGYTLVASAPGLTGVASGSFDVTAATLPTIALDIPGPDIIGLGLTNPLTITLSQPAGAGGVTVAVTSDAAGVVSPVSATVTIPAGATAGQATLSGVALGTTTVHASATAYVSGSLAVQVSDQIVARVSVPLAMGNSHSCLIRSGGALLCWGRNDEGEVGTGTAGGHRLAPTPAATGFSFVAVAAGTYFTCGLTAAGDTYCWGGNVFGSLGNGSTADSANPTPGPMAGGLKFARIYAGGPTGCGLTAAGAAYCWGYNNYGEVGSGSAYPQLVVPTPVAGSHTFAALSVGVQHTCGLTTGGALYCWGDNYNGKLGDGTTDGRLVPTPVVGGLTFSSVTSGQSHTCALDTAGTPYCWGDNSLSELGYGTPPQPSYVPGAVQSAPAFTALSAVMSTCGLAAGGAASCWGYNPFGELGDGTTITRLAPMPVSGGLQFSQLSVGGEATCGLTPAGLLYCWGYNWDGQVGDGTTTDRLVPVPISLSLAP